MGLLLSFPCRCWPWSDHQPPHSSAIPDPDERTPLIFNPPQPTPPPRPVIEVSQQLADEAEAAAQSIVNQTAKCLVDVYSTAPFSHFRVHPPTAPPPQSHSPQGSASTWRAYDPPPRPPVSPDVHRLRLGYDESSSLTQPPGAAHARDGKPPQKKSYHSLKTIIHHHPPPEEHSRDTSANGPPGSTQSTQFHSIRSFQTASDRLEPLPERTGPPVPEFVTNIWPDAAANGARDVDRGDEASRQEMDEHIDHLTDDPLKLREMVKDGFKLVDTGIVIAVDL